MKNLWLYSKMPVAGSRAFLERMARPADAVVCIQDGVYLLQQGNAHLPCPVAATAADTAARGLVIDCPQLDYATLAGMILQAERTITI
jgi:sulfur transfer complex TusBCD TusB component (DsrH family)